MANDFRISLINVMVTNTKTEQTEWVDFPLGKGQRSIGALNSLGIKGKHYEVSGAAFQKHYVVCDAICGGNIHEINWFSRLYYRLDNKKRELFRCITESGCMKGTTLKDLINLILTDFKGFYSLPASNYSELFAYYNYTNEHNCPIALSANEPVPVEFFDVLGRCIAEKENGKFFEGGYYGRRKNVIVKDVYGGNPDDVPERMRVRFE
ncbi:MAG: hypothetical protein E7583_10645 [Ruminococcaceae bacterium]|nr:hypothetical protein [Oscillospiraceae bacterium]